MELSTGEQILISDVNCFRKHIFEYLYDRGDKSNTDNRRILAKMGKVNKYCDILLTLLQDDGEEKKETEIEIISLKKVKKSKKN